MGETRINDYRKTLSDFFTKNMHYGTKFAIKAPPFPQEYPKDYLLLS